MKAKSVFWLGKSRDKVKAFAKAVRSAIGYQIYRVQHGNMPTDYKAMPQIGKGVFEIRIHRPHEHRVVYVAKLKERIYILHAFEKKTRKTARDDINTAKKNYQDLMNRLKNLNLLEKNETK